MDEDEEYESHVFNFFLGIFEGSDHLRRYYKKNGDRGEFICLVCAATGAKVGRQYADCVSLVQHANAICKTKRPLAHRALAHVVCQVLGWDITRLPSIVLDATEQKDDSLGEESIKEKEEIHGEMSNNAGHMRCAEIIEIADSPNKDAAFSENKQSSRDTGVYVEIDDDSYDYGVDWDLVSKEVNKQISRDIGEYIEVDADDGGVVDWDIVTEDSASQDANNRGQNLYGSSSRKG